MRKSITLSGYALFALVILLPFGVISSRCFGCTFKLANYPAFAIVTALLALGSVILSVIMKKPIENRSIAVLFALITPFALINAFLYLLECSTAPVVISMFVCLCCCAFLAVRHGRPAALKITVLILSAVTFLLIGRLLFFALILFGDLSENTVVKTVESPNGVYCAEVIDSDQGALGGDTFVDVCENVVDAYVFKISKDPKRIYQGDWAEYTNMEIYWKDDHCLVINSVEYTIE